MYISKIFSSNLSNYYNSQLGKNSKNLKDLDFSSKTDEKNNYIISIPIPGIPTENVKILRSDKILSIQVNENGKQEETSQLLFDVSRKYDISKLSVKHKLGILTITIPVKDVNDDAYMVKVPIES